MALSPGVDAFPLQASVKFNIPLIIYGESGAEVSGKATYFDKPNYSIDYWLKYSSKVKPDGMLDKNISKKDVNIFQWPSIKDLKNKKPKESTWQTTFFGTPKGRRSLLKST